MLIENDWDNILKEEYKKDYFKKLVKFVREEYQTKKIYPPAKNVFKALKLTKYRDVKVVIIGQDPYHNEGEAQGLAFSVPTNVKIPPSLQNIFKELKSDLGIEKENGNLEEWAKQGVLLLNTVLTVEKNKPNSHRKKGWEIFTDKIIESLNEKDNSIVFLLWGNNAKEKQKLITNKKHLILSTTHPSPFSYFSGFKGCKHFSQTNEFLQQKNQSIIKW
jgi:uracil-DNA glycosylase